MANKSLRVNIAIKLLIMFLPVFLIADITLGTVAYRLASKGMKQSVNNYLDSVATDLANQIDGINQKQFTALHFVAEVAALKDENATLEEKVAQLKGAADALGGYYANLAFYDREGNAYMSDGRFMNFKDRPYLQAALSGKDFISDPMYVELTQSVLQNYAVPVYNNDRTKVVGALVLVISGNTINDTIEKIDLGNGMHPSVINWKTAQTIANINEGTDENANGTQQLDETTGLGLVLSHIFEGKEGIEDFVDPNIGTHLIASYKKIPNTDWTVFAVAPYDMHFKVLSAMQNSMLFTMFIILAIATIIIIILLRLLVKPLRTVKTSIETIASGQADLTQRIPDATNDEIGDVVNGFNGFVKKLQDIVTNLQNSKASLTSTDEDLQASTQDASASITEIISNIESVNNQIKAQAGSVHETAGAVNQISSNIESLERMIGAQSESVTQASAAVEEMIGNINSVNTSVGKMISSFTTLQRNSEIGIDTQNNANEKIMRIEEQSKMLQDANIAIANIAEQTNLLAMNAAIEAAHAGEAGKGFAVVADEIRKLSETSTNQSKTIGTELQNIQETIQEVVRASSDTNTAFSSISQNIKDTNQIIEQITAAMEEQQVGSRQIITSLQSMNNSTTEVKTASAEMTEGNKQILKEMQKLQEATATIQNSIQEMHVGAKRINETGAALSVISGQVAENIKQIGAEIDLFKV